ncbi:MAG: hypothetical protein ACREDO_05395 [Methyloceanibacter sp.]
MDRTPTKVTTIPTKLEPLEVPLSLAAASRLVEKRGGKDQDDVFAVMVDTAGDITKAAERVRDTVTKILGNQMNTSIKNAADARASASKIFTRLAPRLDTVRQRTEAAIEQLEQSTQPPRPKDVAAGIYAGECRAALLRMSPAERACTVEQAISDGDDAFVAAAVSGNVALTGLGKAEAVALCEAWRRKRHRSTVERITRLRAGLDEFNRVSSLLGGWSLGVLADKNAAIDAATRSAELAAKAVATAEVA